MLLCTAVPPGNQAPGLRLTRSTLPSWYSLGHWRYVLSWEWDLVSLVITAVSFTMRACYHVTIIARHQVDSRTPWLPGEAEGKPGRPGPQL